MSTCDSAGSRGFLQAGTPRRVLARLSLGVSLLASAGVLAATSPTAAAGGESYAQVTGYSRYPCGVLCVLAPTGTSVSVTGSGGILAVNQGIMVDSTSSPAVNMTGSGVIEIGANGETPGTIGVTGAASSSVHATGPGLIQGTTISPGLQPASDPVAGMSGVAVPLLPGAAQSVHLSGSQTETISPGVYSTIEAAANATINLAPGPYVVTQLVDVTGSATLFGKGVTVYFACSSYPTPCATGQKGASLDVAAGAFVYLAPEPTNASCLGLSAVFDPNNSGSVNITGSGNPNYLGDASAGVAGILYAPSASLNLTGSGSMLLGQGVVGSVKDTSSGILLMAGTAIGPELGLGGLGGPDVCNLAFQSTAEPTVQLAGNVIAGGPAYDYLPNSTTPVVVDAVDGDGDVMTNYDGPVTLSLVPSSGTPGATLGGPLTTNAVNGVATFTGLSVGTPGTFYEMQASAPQFNNGVSTGFDIFPNPSGSCEVTPEGQPGDECSVTTTASNGTASATITYTNQTNDPEYVLIGVTATPGISACKNTGVSPDDSVTTAIYDAYTHVEDFNSVAQVDETVPAQYVPPAPTNPGTGQPDYVVCYATDTPFVPTTTWGSNLEYVGGQTLELGVLPVCGSGPPPPPPPRLSPPPGVGGSGVGPPCTNFDEVNPQNGNLYAEWLTAGDPVGRGE
jgi:hypothetical protein